MAESATQSAGDVEPSERPAQASTAQASEALGPGDRGGNASTDTPADHAIESTRHPVFIFSYLANLALVTANAATFVFADWVAWLSTNSESSRIYQEELPGRIVQYGLAAAITGRLFLGQAIDRFGVRRVWLVMSSLMLSGLLTFSLLTQISALLPIGRILFATGVSGMFTCSAFHIQSSVAEHRRTEFLALLGSSGFVGMTFGPQLADFLRWLTAGQNATFYPAVFGCAALLIVTYLICVLLITHGATVPPRLTTRPSLIRLTWRYWPGMITLVAMMMGVVYTVPSLYLIRFNQQEGFGGIAAYWTTYAIVAFTFRIRTASLSQQVGRHRLVLIGLLAQGLGLWLLIPVTAAWHLLFSAVICGLGHAFLFPSIVSLGAGSFPAQYRGSGTNLTLGCLDIGAGISAPLLGRIVDLERFNGTGFRPMFFFAGLLPVSVAVLWFLTHRRSSDSEIVRSQG